MNSEIEQAFAHPIERSIGSQPDPSLDRISLRDHIVSVEIGAFQLERDMTQRISFNIVVEVRDVADDLDDDVDLILSYDRVTQAIDIELAAERLNLLETLAQRIADRILKEPQAERVFIRIEKLDRGGGALGVEIVRKAPAQTALDSLNAAPLNARVVFFSIAALESDLLSNWIDHFNTMDAPLILAVSAPASTVRSATKSAQAQIDILAIEQSAWALFSYDPRCKVVATRTELDWATKNEQICIWAPSKFVMDAVEPPIELVSDPIMLVDWFAEQIGAIEVVVVGENLPKSTRVPCRAIAIESIEI